MIVGPDQVWRRKGVKRALWAIAISVVARRVTWVAAERTKRHGTVVWIPIPGRKRYTLHVDDWYDAFREEETTDPIHYG